MYLPTLIHIPAQPHYRDPAVADILHDQASPQAPRVRRNVHQYPADDRGEPGAARVRGFVPHPRAVWREGEPVGRVEGNEGRMEERLG